MMEYGHSPFSVPLDRKIYNNYYNRNLIAFSMHYQQIKFELNPYLTTLVDIPSWHELYIAFGPVRIFVKKKLVLISFFLLQH